MVRRKLLIRYKATWDGHHASVTDLPRGHAFYTQALEGTRKTSEKLESLGLPFLRPPDYYCRDGKVRCSHGESEGPAFAREAKRIGKEVQAQKLKGRAVQKKTEIESVTKCRKQSGFKKDGETDSAFEDGKVFGRSKKKRPGVGPGDPSGGVRDSAFGFGGSKVMKKQSTA